MGPQLKGGDEFTVYCKNVKQRCQLHIDPMIKKNKTKLNLCLMKDISLYFEKLKASLGRQGAVGSQLEQ